MQKPINFLPILDCWVEPDEWSPCFMRIRSRSRRQDSDKLVSFVCPGTTCRRDDRARHYSAQKYTECNDLISDAYFEALQIRFNAGAAGYDLTRVKDRIFHAIMDLMKHMACGPHSAQLEDECNDDGKRWVDQLTDMILARDPSDEVPSCDRAAFGKGRKERQVGQKRKGFDNLSPDTWGPIYSEPAAKVMRRQSSSTENGTSIAMLDGSKSPFVHQSSPYHFLCAASGQEHEFSYRNSMQRHFPDDQARETSVSFPRCHSAQEIFSPSTLGNGQSSDSWLIADSIERQPATSVFDTLQEDFDNAQVCSFCGRAPLQAHKPVCVLAQLLPCEDNHEHRDSGCAGPPPSYVRLREYCATRRCQASVCDEDTCWDFTCYNQHHKKWCSWMHATSCAEFYNVEGEEYHIDPTLSVVDCDLEPIIAEDGYKAVEETQAGEMQGDGTEARADLVENSNGGNAVFGPNPDWSNYNLGHGTGKDWEKGTEATGGEAVADFGTQGPTGLVNNSDGNNADPDLTTEWLNYNLDADIGKDVEETIQELFNFDALE
ncbi:hypothetical protein HII31_09228 [Pseudocercospora fuligena]|uniref:Uncharacterized protein n=1 Tax=Pseudocercospora fuligena TaxID=685502 RepID=A0A8H6RED8_9PEZI|nr:hypothetical protein HII31_09228 [Pseudocercospora fuligena]